MISRSQSGWGWIAALVLVLGCDTKADVSVSGGELQLADGTWTEWCPHSGVYADMLAFVDEAKMGMVCTVDNGIACGVKLDSAAECGTDRRTCVDGQVQATKSVTLGCHVGSANPSSGYWTDGSAALTNGKTGDACSFQGLYSRPTEDPCCLESAICNVGSDPRFLIRNRVCAPGCAEVHADSRLTIVSNCDQAVAAQDTFGAPCGANLVCMSNGAEVVDISPSSSEQDTGMLRYATMQWCANGVLINAMAPLDTYVFFDGMSSASP